MAVAAQNTNNSTIRLILQQKEFTGPNFTNWFQNLRIVLRSENKLAHLEHPLIPLPYPVASQAAHDAYDALFDAQNEVACLMLGSMSPDLHRALENYKAYDMIQELKTMFEEQAKQELFETGKAFHACKQKTIAELHAMLKLYEKGIPKKAKTPTVLAIGEGKIQKDKKKPQRVKGKDKGKTKLDYAPKAKIPPSPKRYNLTKDSVCHHYKEVGHWRRNCPSYHVDLKKRKNVNGASTSGIFTIELYGFPNKSWVYDTGCGTHICNTSHGLRGSRKLKHGALSLCYGYVYFMKHKHEIFETFKVFQNKVENQLSKKIKAIRSDRVGYPKETIVYYFYYPLENKIFVARNAEFFENSLTLQEASGSDSQRVGVLIRRSAMIPQAPNRYGFYIDAEEYELGDLNEPPNYKMDVKSAFLNGHLREAAYILGIKIILDRSKRLIALSQSAYLYKTLKKFKMENSKKGSTPMIKKPDYRKSQGAQTPSEPDKDYTKSQIGYVFVLNGRAMDWKSAKQSTTAMYSTEAECIVVDEASIEAV
ncbi:retrotransposon protein, putative, ty1-copia subclass [Tanacetum coccineum]